MSELANIHFKIGQPNTGKSYGFREDILKESFKNENIIYKKIPVSGGIGNEYKGLQNTDLALSYDPINEIVRFGEFLQTLMSAIIQPHIPHIVFLDDFHNQDISSLLSEYTPLFKGGQRVELKDNDKIKNMDIVDLDILKKDDFDKASEFISKWNVFIDSLEVVKESITNRISGDSLSLVYPSNFYLLGGANFNEKTIDIFADWSDRAVIEHIDPLEVMKDEKFKDDDGFVKCVKSLNNQLKDILAYKKIFDYEKYCFGIWKIVNEKGEIQKDEEKQKEIIKFFFSMIKNSLVFNNKNSEINNIGWELVSFINNNNEYFKKLFKLESIDEVDCEILHKFRIYEN